MNSVKQTNKQTKLCYLQDSVGNTEKDKPALKEIISWQNKLQRGKKLSNNDS